METRDNTEGKGFPVVGLNLELVDNDGLFFGASAGGIRIWAGALASETIHGIGKVAETVTVLSVQSHLHVAESILSEGAKTLKSAVTICNGFLKAIGSLSEDLEGWVEVHLP